MALVEVRFGHQVIESPQLLRIEGVSEALYDALTEIEEDVKAELIDGVMIVHSPEKTRHEQEFRFLFVLMNLFAYSQRWGEGSRFYGDSSFGDMQEGQARHRCCS